MKKINFARAYQLLSEKEMKNVLGGSSGRFRCTCHSGSHVPWEGFYITTQSMINSINMNCGSAGGSCQSI